jgi:C4-dicarboxylate-specific signal transduction histidine kinase
MSPDDPKIREMQMNIAREANRAANILQNLSRVGVPEEGQVPGQRQARAVEVDMIVSDALVSLGALLRQRKVEVEMQLDASGQALISPDDLRDLLLDILLFVADAAEPGNPLCVALRRDAANEIAIDIDFVGPSWTEEQRRQLLNPYDSACHGDGSLMLAVSALVLDEQGGRLEVDEIEGRNRISVVLPLISGDE